ncbi:hypothetical protein HYE67_002460 [Fusarium culmorum]|uniref:Uncharacterized protein n=1 Tax=Fusarium culmorum TaxID=5516 RepID=A0A7S8D1H4_FUSCU|nr:hypothetical protein HYE67_002460 [Fusarium culmorum]
MAPPTNDNNDQQGLRRSIRSNLGKPGPSLINGYLTGDAAARPPLRPKRRVGESAAVNDEDDDGDEVASSTPSEPRKKSIVLDCIHVKLLSDMQRPSSPMGQTVPAQAGSLTQQHHVLSPSAPIHPSAPSPLPPFPLPPSPLAPSPLPPSPLAPSPPQQIKQPPGPVDADAMDLDMYLNLDPQDDEHMADAEPSPKAPPKPAKVIDLDIDMGGLGDEFAEVM